VGVKTLEQPFNGPVQNDPRSQYFSDQRWQGEPVSTERRVAARKHSRQTGTYGAQIPMGIAVAKVTVCGNDK